MPTPAQEKAYARLAIAVAEKYKNKIRQRAQLEWFGWENGFEKQLDFPEYARHRTLAPWGFFNAKPPSLGGAFVGSCSTQNEEDETLQDFNLVIDLPQLTFQCELVKEFREDLLFQSNEINEEEILVTKPNLDYPFCKYYIDPFKNAPLPLDRDRPLEWCTEGTDENGEPNGQCLERPIIAPTCTPIFQVLVSRFTQKYPSPVPASTIGQTTDQEPGLETDQEPTLDVTGSVGLTFSVNLSDFAFDDTRAQASINSTPNGSFQSGTYYVFEGFQQYEVGNITVQAGLSDFYDVETLTPKETTSLPDFAPLKWNLPENELTSGDEITHNIQDVVYSGDFMSNKGAGAKEEFDKLVSDCVQLREPISPTEEKGTFTIRDKEGQILFETAIYGKQLVPIQNLDLTYTIKRFNWEPPPEPPPEEDPDLID
jgi:hypothetical protein